MTPFPILTLTLNNLSKLLDTKIFASLQNVDNSISPGGYSWSWKSVIGRYLTHERMP